MKRSTLVRLVSASILLLPFGIVGGLDPVFEMCSVRGSFGQPEVVQNGRHNRARVPVSWRALRGR